MKHFSKITFFLFVVIYLLIRDWPYGSTLQTAADILIVIALILMVIDKLLGLKR